MSEENVKHFVMFNGNNSDLVRKHLEKRPEYIEYKIKNRHHLKEAFSQATFIWATMTYSNTNYQELDYLIKNKEIDGTNLILNQLENIHKLSTKHNLLRNMNQYY